MAAARANWKGYLRLSLVSCPIALYPATSESEKVRFNQLNKKTGNRIRYSKVDPLRAALSLENWHSATAERRCREGQARRQRRAHRGRQGRGKDREESLRPQAQIRLPQEAARESAVGGSRGLNRPPAGGGAF